LQKALVMKRVFAAIAVLGLLFSASAAQAEKFKLTIGTEGAYPPFNYFDKSGKLTGFDVDIAKALCDEMQADCTFVTVPWVDIIPSLEARKFDIIVCSMAYTEERAKRLEYSAPYYRSHSVFIGDPDKFDKSSAVALVGARIAASEQTIQSEFLAKFYTKSTLTFTPDQPTAQKLLIDGKVDLLLGDAIELLQFMESPEGSRFGYVGDPVTGEFLQSTAHITARKGDTEIIAKVNAALEQIRLNGTYDRVNNAYFPFSIY
jgi:ABC-type amino acid transport substrate-binding protein